MPVDYQQVYVRIQEIGAGAPGRSKALAARRARTRDLLRQYASDLDVLRAKVDSALAADANLRCAYPATEPLTAAHAAPPDAGNLTLIAADGSQIIPDRHASVMYSLINIGTVVLRPGSGDSPEVAVRSDLKYGDELYTETSMLTEDLVALGRDLAERKILLELGSQYPAPVIALTDGPVELWGAEGSNPEDYRRTREIHLSILSQLQSGNIITAGYIEKPAADLVTRLMEISQIPADQMQNIRKTHPLRGVTDRWLFGEGPDPLLKPGERSAVFVIQSSSRSHYKGDLEIHFFYVNVGSERHPWIARVEIPAWVAKDGAKVDSLHSALLQQCQVMGAKPYPYILHRAHETAVVKHEEKEQIEQMLIQELRRNNEEVEDGSYKQSAKDLPGRTRR